MPVEFLSDERAEVYGQFIGEPSRAELERFFFLDDADLRRTMAAITSLTTRTSASSMPPAPLAGKARRPSLNFTRKCPDKNMQGRYTFTEQTGDGLRPLRDLTEPLEAEYLPDGTTRAVPFRSAGGHG